jgi:glyoxylase-like metal-dependent hydrolase (beta-lactamase superfamily II)
MFNRSGVIAVLVALMSGALAAQDASSIINNASRAMGGDKLKTIEFSGSGADFALGQGQNPGPYPRFLNKTYTRVINYEMPATQMTRVRLQGENPPHGGGNQPLRGENPQNQTVIVNANTPWVQQLDIWMTPHGFLRAAAANNATVKSQTMGGKTYNVVSFMGKNKAMVNGYINDQNLVEKVETWVDNPMFGDMLVEYLYGLYKDVDGVKFPTSIVQKQAGFPTLEWTVADVKPNAPADIKPAQGGGGGGQAPAQPPSEKLAEGIYLIKGAYASLAVDFKDYIVVIEGPNSEERGLFVIEETKRLIPNKPIRYVVNTHTHFDHSSGLRPFVAEGATVITHEVNRPFLEKVFSAPHTLNPDTLSRAKKTARFETMTTKKVLTDGNHVIELHQQQSTGHHPGIIFAYLPKQKILMEADGYNANVPANSPTPNPVGPYAVNLVENVRRLNLDIDRIISIHMPPDDRKVTLQEMLKAAGQPGAQLTSQ